MQVFLVSHTHWDREWYRTYQAFRARLVDTVDQVLDFIAKDPEYVFLLDGQSVILEDYLEIRPSRRPELAAAVKNRRVAIGPWYVQPDSFIPGGESHVRNLLEGRRVGSEFGPVSRVGYTPDSFGHPAQYPQILSGFGIGTFVHWRGHGDDADRLPNEYVWASPDGSEVIGCLLRLGYGNVASMPKETERAVDKARAIVDSLSKDTRNDRVLLMNGSDHLLPDSNTKEVAEALSSATGYKVKRALLEDFVEGLDGDFPRFRGELIGGRLGHLLPGVWSTRTWLKLRNRRCETLLYSWAEPWVAISKALGQTDETPSLLQARRAFLHNQAHDSICGCSRDEVHEQMKARFDVCEELSMETAKRTLERLAGLGPERKAPWTVDQDLAVFNPSPHTRSGVVNFPLDPFPISDSAQVREVLHPLLWRNMSPRGFTVDGVPARLVPTPKPGRMRLRPDQEDWELEFVVHDVPAFGYRRVHIEPTEESSPDEVDDEREISAGDVRVRAEDDGTLKVSFGDVTYEGLCGLEDVGDRGDSYDFDLVDTAALVSSVEIQRLRHESGIQELVITRTLDVPARLENDRETRSSETVPVRVIAHVRVAPPIQRVDISVQVHNAASDHRLRLMFPTGSPVEKFKAATTFDVAERSTALREGKNWASPPPRTFPHQGWITANNLCVVAPGLLEGEVTEGGTIAITLLRSIGWLSRMDLHSRPGGAGPSIPTPLGQCLGETSARISLLHHADMRAAADAELPMWPVISAPVGAEPILKADTSMLSLEPRELVLSAVKPAEDGNGTIVRFFNPTDETLRATVKVGFPFSTTMLMRLDESPVENQPELKVEGSGIVLEVTPRAIRTLLLT